MNFTSSGFFLVFFIGFLVLLYFLFILESVGLMPPVPPGVYKGIFIAMLLMFFWWPIDMLIHWEKRTPASMLKDRILVMLAVAIILFVYPYHWLGTPFWPTLGVSILFGIVFPSTFLALRFFMGGRYAIEPERVYRIAGYSPSAQEFLKYFPNARIYALGLTEMDGNHARCIFHQREPFTDIESANIDFVLDVPVDRKVGIYIAGKERLQCYLFIQREGECRIGFLPAVNVGRALDYGFSDEELDRAMDEIRSLDQSWKPLSDKPIMVQHYKGKVVTLR